MQKMSLEAHLPEFSAQRAGCAEHQPGMPLHTPSFLRRLLIRQREDDTQDVLLPSQVQVLTEVTGRQRKRYVLNRGQQAQVEATSLTRDEQAQGLLDAAKGGLGHVLAAGNKTKVYFESGKSHRLHACRLLPAPWLPPHSYPGLPSIPALGGEQVSSVPAQQKFPGRDPHANPYIACMA